MHGGAKPTKYCKVQIQDAPKFLKMGFRDNRSETEKNVKIMPVGLRAEICNKYKTIPARHPNSSVSVRGYGPCVYLHSYTHASVSYMVGALEVIVISPMIVRLILMTGSDTDIDSDSDTDADLSLIHI